ncbi:aminoglycoside phosphotransferase family protein [Bacillus salacetis]|uniref:Aminoglycoside phosphotransferase family protein n=1 Tax=Bacillus salacetis TaxID=2315464 RepID=A0A3A1R7R3_9BACI|nr:phosphotransferase [Bacillus salacetis]RIW37373.1 aminoglycoside phosphotransferase family protein [Bacillus salacetis]
MREHHVKSIIEDVCMHSSLGDLVAEPERTSGGLLHKMYEVETTTGKYAIKLLNPQIMQRPQALINYIQSEKIARFLSAEIPAVNAIDVNGEILQKVDSQYYLMFNWVEGTTLTPTEITNSHCEKIGGILAAIHEAKVSELDVHLEKNVELPEINWDEYLRKGEEQEAEWVPVLQENRDQLYEWNSRAAAAENVISLREVISHRDLDPKNVLWHKDSPALIDWESAGLINPIHDLLDTAIYWSENDDGDLEKGRFLSFLEGYEKVGGVIKADWRRTADYRMYGTLAWLEYNMKRSLWMECTDREEQELRTKEVTAALSTLKKYAQIIPELLIWLDNDR